MIAAWLQSNHDCTDRGVWREMHSSPSIVGTMMPDIHGSVLSPADPEYAAACAAFNQSIVHSPKLVVQATAPTDVETAIRYASGHGLPVGVQATGHGPSQAATGLLINTSQLTGAQVNPAARTVRVAAGTRWRDVLAATTPHGLAPLNGSAPDVGVTGYTLGGGLGPLGRLFGYAVSTVRSLEVVTADGVGRQVDAKKEPDLFWALRGGRDNFGIVTGLELDLFPVARLYGGGLFFDGADVPTLLKEYLAWTESLPDELTSSVILVRLPDFPGVPAPLRGRYVAHVRIAFVGPPSVGEQLVRPLRNIATPLLDTVDEMPYEAVGTISNDPTTPEAVVLRSTMLRELPPAALDAVLEQAGPEADAPYVVEIRHLGGALSRPMASDNPLSYPDANYLVTAIGRVAPLGASAVAAAQDQLMSSLTPWQTDTQLVTFLGPDDATPTGVRRGYRPGVYQRLAALKAHYDPDNMFRTSLNIAPEASK